MKRAALATLFLVCAGCAVPVPSGAPGQVGRFQDFYPRSLVDVEGTLFFIATDGRHGSEVWRSHGTRESTRMVKDVTPGPAPPERYPGSCSQCLNEPASLTRVGRRLFFIASDRRHGWEPWVSDGTEGGTRMVEDVTPGEGSSQFGTTSRMVELRGAALFAAREPVLGLELWRSDGTARGTRPVRDIGPGTGGVVPSTLFSAGDRAYLIADDGLHGRELWATDGIGSGTLLLADIAPGPASPEIRGGLVRDEPTGLDYFAAHDGSSWALWRTDGTAAGTAPVVHLPAAARVVAAAKRVLLTVEDPEHGEELWASDGTAAGTGLLKDIYPGRFGSRPEEFLRVGDAVLFSAGDAEHGHELWRTDGTADGTALVYELTPGPAHGSPHFLTRAGRLAYFTASDPVGKQSLWMSDGTAAGTRLVRPADGQSISNLAVSGPRLFFTTCSRDRESEGVCELWVIDLG